MRRRYWYRRLPLLLRQFGFFLSHWRRVYSFEYYSGSWKTLNKREKWFLTLILFLFSYIFSHSLVSNSIALNHLLQYLASTEGSNKFGEIVKGMVLDGFSTKFLPIFAAVGPIFLIVWIWSEKAEGKARP